MLHNLKDKKIILGSKSPRRQDLLKGLDIEFEIRTKDVEESYPDYLANEDVPLYLAEKKAHAFIDELQPNEIVITSDTIVILNDMILEKPGNRDEAIGMVQSLSDRVHTVVTGVCIESSVKKESFICKTRVEFEDLSPEEIEFYIDKYKPYDKAGSYGVQEWIGYVGIKKLTGSYFNVMGLPVHMLYQKLKKF